MNEVIKKVRKAGVVGAGGAGFPTDVKLNGKAEIVIANGAECEPLLKTDQQLAAVYPEFLVKGLAGAMESTGAKEGIIALKKKNQAAITAIERYLTSNMRIFILPDIYPAGDEVMTTWLATGRRVPPGRHPIDIGVVVNNVQTLINIAEAMDGVPVTTRTLTVTGAVKKPVTVKVPIGTRLFEVVALAGGTVEVNPSYILGGPIMGSQIFDLSLPVTKTTGGLIVLPSNHPLIRRNSQSISNVLRIAKSVCEQCSMCTDLCPRHLIGHALLPHLNVRSVNFNHIGNKWFLSGALLCSECGLCEVYACPTGISPRRINIALKEQMREHGITYRGKLGGEDSMATYRLVPSNRLISRLGLKSWCLEAPLMNEPHEPIEVVINLCQHIGKPAIPTVKVGDKVKKGDLIGKIPIGALGAMIHASIAGKVIEVLEHQITIRNGDL